MPRAPRTREACFHLRPREGTMYDRVHDRGHERLVLRLVGDEAVVVEPLVLARPRLHGRVRLRPREEPLEDRAAAEHPAGRVVPRDDGVVDAEPREAVARLQAARGRCRRRPPGTRPAGRGARRPLSHHSSVVARRCAITFEHPHGDGGIREQEPTRARPPGSRGVEVGTGDDLGRRRDLEERRTRRRRTRPDRGAPARRRR